MSARQGLGGGTFNSLEVVVDVLERAGYRKLSVPYQIGNVEFDFGLPMIPGEGRLELILVVSMRHADIDEVSWNVQNVARGLDVAGSSRSITVVLVGESGIKESPTHRLQAVARVLRVGVHVADRDAVERALAPLRPLRLELSASRAVEEPMQAIEKYAHAKADSGQLRTLILRSRAGSAHVEMELLSWIEKSFTLSEPDE